MIEILYLLVLFMTHLLGHLLLLLPKKRLFQYWPEYNIAVSLVFSDWTRRPMKIDRKPYSIRNNGIMVTVIQWKFPSFLSMVGDNVSLKIVVLINIIGSYMIPRSKNRPLIYPEIRLIIKRIIK
jgi:hypothetical protein